MKDELSFDPLTRSVEFEKDSENAGIDFSALQQSFDTSWGRSSTPQTAQHSVKFQIQGSNRLIATYAAIVNFASERGLIEQKRRCADEASTVLKAHSKFVKDRYKAITGSTISLEEVKSADSVEIVGMQSFGNFVGKRTACFRRTVVYFLS